MKQKTLGIAWNHRADYWRKNEKNRSVHERRTDRKKKKHESRKLAETARTPEQSANTRCGGFKKCLPAEYPQADFPEANMRINYEPCSNSRTARDARGWGENWSPLLQSNQGSGLSLRCSRGSPCPSVSLLCTFRSPPLSSQIPFSSRLLSLPLSFFLFYFSFEALFNFCREIFPVHDDYYSQEMEEENRSREPMQGGSYDRCKRMGYGSREIVWKCLDNSATCMLYRLPMHVTFVRLVFNRNLNFKKEKF